MFGRTHLSRRRDSQEARRRFFVGRIDPQAACPERVMLTSRQRTRRTCRTFAAPSTSIAGVGTRCELSRSHRCPSSPEPLPLVTFSWKRRRRRPRRHCWRSRPGWCRTKNYSLVRKTNYRTFTSAHAERAAREEIFGAISYPREYMPIGRTLPRHCTRTRKNPAEF